MLNSYPDILTVTQTSEILQISKKSVYKLIHSNQLQAKKIASHYRIQKKSLIEFLNQI